uniref:Amiloride-sensitive sodium channel n=3 Tax=Macrostomum lignano TaxID=282301 RepID=A0A1I8JJA3_9PLAT
MLPEAARFFLETTSIRGVGKIVKTQNVFLSRLWALFVLASTSLLCYSVFKIIVDYLQYDVNIQTYHDIDDATPFPAVSICNNQAFSKNAYRLWADNRVRSPSEFNRQLRQKALRMLSDPEFRAAYSSANQSARQQLRESIQNRAYMSMHTSLVMDNSRTYYQNTAANDSILLGHERNESLVECVIKYSSRQALGTKGCHDPMLNVTLFSDPNFFNCMTIEFNEDSWSEVLSLTLIVWLGPDENYDMRHRQGFLYDVFEQAYGLRVAIHEPRTQPKILERGIQTEPGKMNEIKYQPVRFVRENTPKKPCISPEETSHVKLRDLYNEYNYDQELCLDSKVQAMVLEKCGCLYIELPRIAIPNATHPYCGIIDDKMLQRSACIQDLHLRELRKSYETTECLPTCVDRSFDKELSVTKWRDTQWMIYWIKELCERWDNYFGQLQKDPLPPMNEFDKSLNPRDYLT